MQIRRWRLAIAMVAALSLFTAVITGWASREVPPDPVHAAATATAAHSQPEAQGSSPMHALPTKHAWMARERPQMWTPLSPPSDWSAWPASADPSDGAARGAPATAPDDPDILALFCINRR